MQYVWQHRLWLPEDMTAVDGRRIDVLDPGLLNTGSGPDFFNAKIRIGADTWAGNIEIHVRASDWHRHGHDSDPAYDSVILHVVGRDDARIARSDGREIPQVCMPCVRNFAEIYSGMVDNRSADLGCAAFLDRLPRVYVSDWLTSLGFERVIAKAERVSELHRRLNGDWRETVYVVLARALGFGTNSDPFERLALATPLHRLMRHRDSLVTLEGALFGQAGFLDSLPPAVAEQSYVREMAAEYAFVARKYGWSRPLSLNWRMGRMRPQNFPHRRLAALAEMVYQGFRPGTDMLHVTTEAEARELFDVTLCGYWGRRYNFTSETAPGYNALSKMSVTSLIINVVVPVLHAYGHDSGRPELCDRAIDLLMSLPAENNLLVRTFTDAGIDCPDAFTSQAMIQLRRGYCEPRKCLYCRIGHRMLAERAVRRTPVREN